MERLRHGHQRLEACAMSTLLPVYCANAACPEQQRVGRPQLVGKVERGAWAELRCPKCRSVRLFHATEVSAGV